ncbi:protein of unknown function [Methylocaldum szegediense]|uniref:Tryptophan synthase n=1 Tax=Methylocaldum szegediense TaxID=73780 RepID=A0ABM9I9A0_9GAMM|nr:protein of unknown function [Methylocaldum szegediense]
MLSGALRLSTTLSEARESAKMGVKAVFEYPKAAGAPDLNGVLSVLRERQSEHQKPLLSPPIASRRSLCRRQ